MTKPLSRINLFILFGTVKPTGTKKARLWGRPISSTKMDVLIDPLNSSVAA